MVKVHVQPAHGFIVFAGIAVAAPAAAAVGGHNPKGYGFRAFEVWCYPLLGHLKALGKLGAVGVDVGIYVAHAAHGEAPFFVAFRFC
jgi:hypothetical protein